MRRLGRLAGFAIMMLMSGTAARAQAPELDPPKVNDSPAAIFQSGSAETKQALNANAVSIITGTIGGTYVQFGADLASVLDDGNQLRILPMVGHGSAQNVADILYLQGVDLGIVRTDTFDYLEKNGQGRNLRNQFSYVTKLYNEEMHVIAPKTIRSLRELDGKMVSVDLPNGGTFVTAQIVFEKLGIRPKFVYVEQRIALERLKSGELDAVIAVQGKPSAIISQLKDERLHLVGVDYDRSLQSDYLPASLSARDYPNLIADGEQVDTIAVPAVLAAYNWAPNTVRYRKLAMFVEAFFTKFPALQNPPFHPKWTEVSLSAPVPGWRRFAPAKQWLDSHGVMPVASTKFDDFSTSSTTTALAPTTPRRPAAAKDATLRQFQAWQVGQNDRPPPVVARPPRKRDLLPPPVPQ
jgi:TRAP transporter TAXI family solute receptor